MIIDIHNHLRKKTELIDFLRTNKLGIKKIGLAGLPPYFGFSTNKEVEKIINNYPEYFFGWYWIASRLKIKTSGLKNIIKRGFTGFKFTTPHIPYGSRLLFPIYKFAEDNNIPCLFHTGIVGNFKPTFKKKGAYKSRIYEARYYRSYRQIVSKIKNNMHAFWESLAGRGRLLM